MIVSGENRTLPKNNPHCGISADHFKLLAKLLKEYEDLTKFLYSDKHVEINKNTAILHNGYGSVDISPKAMLLIETALKQRVSDLHSTLGDSGINLLTSYKIEVTQ